MFTGLLWLRPASGLPLRAPAGGELSMLPGVEPKLGTDRFWRLPRMRSAEKFDALVLAAYEPARGAKLAALPPLCADAVLDITKLMPTTNALVNRFIASPFRLVCVR
jgi:hypothetical protein